MKEIIIKIIFGYKRFISPIFSFFGVRCKYYPTCSSYMIQAIEKYGCVKGLGLGLYRFIRCNPFSKGGYDPVK